jgi:hypothetical protein
MPNTSSTGDTEHHERGIQRPNTTQTPDVLFDKWLPELTFAELKVLLYIVRRIFGFRKDTDEISLKQICEGVRRRNGKVLDKGTGLSRKAAFQAVQSLEKRGLIKVDRAQAEDGVNLVNIYSLVITDESEEEKQEADDDGVGTSGTYGYYRRYLPVGTAGTSQQTVKQQTDINTSSTRKASPKKKKTDKATQTNSHSKQPVVSVMEFTTPETAAIEQPPKLTIENREAASPAQPPSPAPPLGLTRSYLTQARESANAEQPPNGMTPIASLLPTQQPTPRPSATEAWQVLVDLLSDVSREFRDEAKLSESVSRAYNLVQQAKITDIGVFTAKIYEARAITKSRYATINRRMPYFFSVLSDVCGLKPTNAAQPLASG